MTARPYASLDFAELMNALVGNTTRKDPTLCANQFAGTTGKDIVEAFNAKLGTRGLDLPDVLSRLAGIRTTDVNLALAALVNANLLGPGSVLTGFATGTGTAFNPTISITGDHLSVNAGLASGTGTAFGASAGAVGSVNAGLASGTGTSNNPSVSISVNAGLASGTGTARDATISSGAWTPASPSGLIAWYDASNAGSITSSGGLVSQWNDLSGNGYNLTASGTQRPTTGSRTQNSKNVIDFDGANNFMTASGFTALAKPYTLLLMCIVDSNSGESAMVSTAGNVAFYVKPGNTTFSWRTPSADSANKSLDFVAHMWICTTATGATTIALDGGSSSNGTGDTATWGSTIVGSLSGSFQCNGAIFEMAVYNNVLGSTDKASALAYSQAKWGTP